MDTTTTATAVNRSHENTSTLNTSTAFRADLNVSLRYRHDALSSHEKWWMERYDFLESRGYRLRPRYRPGWEPSWRTNGMRLHKCEDRIRILTPDVLDAFCIKDNKHVLFKRMEAESEEYAIARMLSSPERRKDPNNHAVPILDSFTEGKHAFLVMPLLRPFDDPPFDTVNEVVDFVRQMIQGLKYLHDLNVAHRDCYLGNIMMDATNLIPGGFHPRLLDKTFDFKRQIKPLKRSSLKEPVRYYFIDFGLSSWFRKVDSDDSEATVNGPADKSLRRLVKGNKCQDPHISELNSSRPYDPFLLDIGILGNVFKRAFVNKYSNLEFLIPVANRMSLPWPERRPSEEEALKYFNECVDTVSSASLRWRLKPRDERRLPAVLRDMFSAASEMKYQVVRVSSYPFRRIRRWKRA